MFLESGDSVVTFDTVLLHHRLADFLLLLLPRLLQPFGRLSLHGIEKAVVLIIESRVFLLLVVVQSVEDFIILVLLPLSIYDFRYRAESIS